MHGKMFTIRSCISKVHNLIKFENFENAFVKLPYKWVVGVTIGVELFSLIPLDKFHHEFYSGYKISGDALIIFGEYVTGRKVEEKDGEFESDFYP